MGFRDVDWAYSLDLPSGQKVVLAALCHRTDDKTHETFVGRKALASMVGMTDRGISKILAALEEAGVIVRQERRRKDGYRDTDLITVKVAPLLNEVQMNHVQVNEDPVNDVPTSGERRSDLRGTSFQASAKALVTHRSPTDHSMSSPSARKVEEQFGQAYAAWPKKVKRKDSLEAFIRAAKKRDPETLVAEIIRFGQAYAATTESHLVPALCVWLRGERWDDDLPTRGMPSEDEWNALLAGTHHALTPPVAIDRTPRCLTHGHRWLPDGTCMNCVERRDDIPSRGAA